MTGITDALMNCRAVVGNPHNQTTNEMIRGLPRPVVGEEHRLELVPPMVVKEIKANKIWGIALPITSFGSTEEQCWSMIERFEKSLVDTTNPEERPLIMIMIGIDTLDPVYDQPQSKERLENLFSNDKFQVYIYKMHLGFQGNVCSIWNFLIQKAVQKNAHFLVLLGDDVEIKECGWKKEIEDEMYRLSDTSGLPNGMACVAFKDLSSPGFPCFPVIHRHHIRVFGNAVPEQFVNQDGDPYLFALYRRFGASSYSQNVSLTNGIGGFDKARYNKQSPRESWKTKILNCGIEKLKTLTEKSHKCIDIIIPTFRCDNKILTSLCSLETTYKNVSIQVIIVVDNPNISNDKLSSLIRWKQDRWVRVWYNKSNLGASQSRNVGISQSSGDYTILLDDDVIPDENLIDAYLGGIQRFPDAKILVGNTEFPVSKTLIEKSIKISGITHFYGISNKITNPPWGVTANLCVKHRELGIWFDSIYPKTGGGEDVDFCIRVRHKYGNSSIVSVPEAKVTHPYWSQPIKQIWGWAKGDSICLDKLPSSSFYRPPNWLELWIPLSIYDCSFNHFTVLLEHLCLCVGVNYIVSLAETYPKFVSITKGESKKSTWFLGALVAPLFEIVQTVARLIRKFYSGNLYQISCSMDWMDGTDRGTWKQAERLAHLIRIMAILVCLVGKYINLRLVSTILVMVISIFHGWCQNPQWKIYSTSKNLKTSENRFIILAWQRTGSNLLCGMLHNHPQVMMHNEIFNRSKIHSYHKNLIDNNWSIEKRNKDKTKFINWLFEQKMNKHAVGFKLFPEHIDDSEDFVTLLSDPTIKKIILKRNDAMSVYASQRRSLLNGNFMLKEIPDKNEISISPQEMQIYLSKYDLYYKTLEKILSQQHFLNVSYEELNENTAREWKRITGFLEISFTTPKSLLETVKIDRPIIINKEELKESFKFTKYKNSQLLI